MPRLDEAVQLALGTTPVNRMVLAGQTVWESSSSPVNTVLPQISGDRYVDEELSVNTGTWINNPTSFSYQWFQNGVAVGTGPTFTFTEPGEVYCSVTGTNAFGSTSVSTTPEMVFSPPGTYTIFTNPIPTMTIESGGMRARKINNTDPPHYGHCSTADPIEGKVYIEVLLTFNAPSTNAAVFHFYGGTRSPSEYPTDASVGWWWNEPGVAIGITGVWTAILYANSNLPGEVGNSAIYSFPNNPMPVTRRFIFCVDSATRAIWFRTTDGPAGWVGGGDPVAGTNPTVVLAGSSPIFAGATSSYSTNIVEMVNPDLYIGPIPAGYTRGILSDGSVIPDPDPDVAPANITAASINGTNTSGSLLTATPGTWSGTAPITIAGQWMADGAPISGATELTYTIAVPTGSVITYRETATNAISSASQASNAITVAAAPEPGLLMQFESRTGANVLLSNNATRHGRTGGGNAYSHTRLTRPVIGKRYLETRLRLGTGNTAAVMNIYGGTQSSYPTSSSLGQWWNEPGVALGTTSIWSAILYSHYGDGGPNTISNGSAYDLGGVNPLPLTLVARMAIDSATRAVWVAINNFAWYGGGNPETGVNPSFHMEGTGDIYVGGTANNNNNWVDIIQTDALVYSVPAGFTAGV